MEDYTLIYMVVDASERAYMVITSDKPGRSGWDVRDTKIEVVGNNLAGKGVDLALQDDFVDTYKWDEATAQGSFTWRWWSCCTDGVVIGPMPYTNYSLDIYVNRRLVA